MTPSGAMTSRPGFVVDVFTKDNVFGPHATSSIASLSRTPTARQAMLPSRVTC